MEVIINEAEHELFPFRIWSQDLNLRLSLLYKKSNKDDC